MKQKILITGSGVLGAYLAEELIKKKYKVFVTSRFYKKNFKNYEYLKISSNVEFLKLDILNKDQIKKIIDEINPVKIFYFSGQSSLVKSLKFTKKTFESNYLGVKNFLEVIEKNKYNISFFKANSGYIFDSKSGVISLKSRLSKSKNPYIKAQIKAYSLIKKFRDKGVDCHSIIMLQVESPLRSKHFFIKKVCSHAKLGNKIKVGNINTVRDYSWAPEIAQGIYYFSQSKIKDIILSSGIGLSGTQILDEAYRLNNLKSKNFYQVNKKYLRDKEIKVLIGRDKNKNDLYKKFKWKTKIDGINIVKLMYKLI